MYNLDKNPRGCAKLHEKSLRAIVKVDGHHDLCHQNRSSCGALTRPHPGREDFREII
jgi:hypothetical protein